MVTGPAYWQWERRGGRGWMAAFGWKRRRRRKRWKGRGGGDPRRLKRGWEEKRRQDGGEKTWRDLESADDWRVRQGWRLLTQTHTHTVRQAVHEPTVNTGVGTSANQTLGIFLQNSRDPATRTAQSRISFARLHRLPADQFNDLIHSHPIY